MALTMRPTDLGHGVYKDSIDYDALSGEYSSRELSSRPRACTRVGTVEPHMGRLPVKETAARATKFAS